jgi:uncharacterized OsmC-like protein
MSNTGIENLNGIDINALTETAGAIAADPSKGIARLGVTTEWSGQTRTKTTVTGYELGGEWIERSFTFETDEPLEVCGGNQAPNPQEYLMAALNACMIVGYVANAALRGIRIEKLLIRTEGELDLRGFLGIDENVAPGNETIRYEVAIRCDGTREQVEEIHEVVKKTSPNYFNITRPVALESKLVVIE